MSGGVTIEANKNKIKYMIFRYNFKFFKSPDLVFKTVIIQ